jgi:Bacterial Ig domain
MSMKWRSFAGAIAITVAATGGTIVSAGPAGAATGGTIVSAGPAGAATGGTFLFSGPTGAATTEPPAPEKTTEPPTPEKRPPTVELTSPSANPDVPWGHDLRLAASASDADGVVTKVEFYRGDTLLYVATTAPYEFTYTVVGTAGGFTLFAKATDNDGLTATSRHVSAFAFSPAETITGVVQPGVEFGCWSLVTDKKRYLLLGGDRTLFTAGARLQVRGTSRPNEITFCQQDTPFLVYSAQPA